MKDVVVIGGGPAGLASSLFLRRGGLDVVVVDSEHSTLKQARLRNVPLVDAAGMSGPEFLKGFRSQVEESGVEFVAGSAVDLEPMPGGFITRLREGNELTSSIVILATGSLKIRMSVPGLKVVEAKQPYVKANLACNAVGETGATGVYVAGVAAGLPSQVMIAAGHGALVAHHILSELRGEWWVDHDELVSAVSS